jgi:hypothetical protein
MPIKAIETRYAGYRFRSRLEARWAVFFESLGAQWEYEPEGFDLDSVQYLPDFRVTTGDLVYWYEVKPKGTDSCEKFLRFYNAVTKEDEVNEYDYRDRKLNIEARILSGDPFDVFYMKHLCPRCGMEVESFDDNGHEWSFMCSPCDMVTASGGDNPVEIGFAGTLFYPHKGWIMASKEEYFHMNAKIGRACRAAREARFEHGETPQ